MLRESGASSTPRPIDSITAVSGILGRPVKPGDDNWICVRLLAARCARGWAEALARWGERADRRARRREAAASLSGMW